MAPNPPNPDTPEARRRIESYFSGLQPGSYDIIGGDNPGYNCFAHAAGKADIWLGPRKPHPFVKTSWPLDLPLTDTVDVIIQLFAKEGYTPCQDGSLEVGFEKIAIYAKSGRATHAAKQVANDRWSSKLGREETIVHVLTALEGMGQHEYGNVTQFLKRPIAQAASDTSPACSPSSHE